jgi:hypothetical protein
MTSSLVQARPSVALPSYESNPELARIQAQLRREGILSPREVATLRKAWRGRYFLLRQGATGELYACAPKKAAEQAYRAAILAGETDQRRLAALRAAVAAAPEGCGGKHDYFTLNCVERPWHGGPVDAIWTYLRVKGARVEHGILRDIPDLATVHPDLARALAAGATDELLLTVTLGISEPITATTAQVLADRINAKGCSPPFQL